MNSLQSSKLVMAHLNWIRYSKTLRFYSELHVVQTCKNKQTKKPIRSTAPLEKTINTAVYFSTKCFN